MRIRGRVKSQQVMLVALAVLAATAYLGFPEASRDVGFTLNSSPPPIAAQLPDQAVADFDGDRLPDRAELVSNGSQKNIHLNLSSPRASSLYFYSETQRPGNLYAEDIDRDSDEDLIWVSDQQPTHTALWLNNGIGEFTRVAKPSAYSSKIKRLIAIKNQSALVASSAHQYPMAAGTISFPLLPRRGSAPPVAPHSATRCEFFHYRALELAPCITRYRKRGPPIFRS